MDFKKKAKIVLVKLVRYTCILLIALIALILGFFFLFSPDIKTACAIFVGYSISWVPLVMIAGVSAKKLKKIEYKLSGKAQVKDKSLSDRIKYLRSDEFKRKTKERIQRELEDNPVPHTKEKEIVPKGREK